ncbi:sitruin, putative [Acanthamoeba castellanii str. Neff]|uniref:Sitruin, putative n=1 Tax=Acanthamoeba castellanii (strain ATCC 30010 / Neff) TaxID=1257118 RepID=L8GIH5_ACACF|nr:sitruin, putative [Acanthamoeba castellanii str. Neff]ELR12553.1 sitruin, putative [Acanthamoeba castellanii str. Neff]
MGVAACGKECMGQCITPVPLRFQSLSSRRKRKTDEDDDEAEEKPKPIDELRHSKIKEHAKREAHLLKRIKRISATPADFPDLVQRPINPLAGLRSLSLAGVVHLIQKGKCANIIVMCGAGISVSAGIPDFRTPGTGLYYNLQRFNLPTPASIFDIDYFVENPEPFYTLAKELYPGSYKPTVVHHFIRLLADKGLLLRNYTQNIDGLERIAGVPVEKVVEAHGSFFGAHCIKCEKVHDPAEIRDVLTTDGSPICDECDGFVKPDVVFFGEPLPPRFHTLAERDFEKCDLLVVLGTSLQVQPFSKLIDKVPSTVPRLLINRQEVGKKHDDTDGKKGGFRFRECDNARDIEFLGDCDMGIGILAELLGWKEELAALASVPPVDPFHS